MESINSEWDVIRLIEKELNNRKDDELKNQLKYIKDLAHSIQSMIDAKEPDYRYIHKETSILCKHLGTLWQKVFNHE